MKKRNQIARTEGAYDLVRREQYTPTPLSVFLPLIKFGRSLCIKLVRMFSKSCAILLLSAAACSALNTEDVSLSEDQSDPRVFFANYTSSKSEDRWQVHAYISIWPRKLTGNREKLFAIWFKRNTWWSFCFISTYSGSSRNCMVLDFFRLKSETNS